MFSVSIVDVAQRKLVENVAVPGSTRWAIFEAKTGRFYVNISNSSEIAVIDAAKPTRIERLIDVPVTGPHGLDLDSVKIGQQTPQNKVHVRF